MMIIRRVWFPWLWFQYEYQWGQKESLHSIKPNRASPQISAATTVLSEAPKGQITLRSNSSICIFLSHAHVIIIPLKELWKFPLSHHQCSIAFTQRSMWDGREKIILEIRFFDRCLHTYDSQLDVTERLQPTCFSGFTGNSSSYLVIPIMTGSGKASNPLTGSTMISL